MPARPLVAGVDLVNGELDAVPIGLGVRLAPGARRAKRHRLCVGARAGGQREKEECSWRNEHRAAQRRGRPSIVAPAG